MKATFLNTAIAMLIVGTLATASWLSSRPRRGHQPVYEDAERDPQEDAASPFVVQHGCADCHEQIVADHGRSPHARTLSRVEPATIEAFLLATRRDGLCGDLGLEGSRLVVNRPDTTAPAVITWVFGSGTHAQTPVSTWLDPEGNTVMLEHAISWYPPGQLGPTLGLSLLTADSPDGFCGKLLNPEATRSCFGCHASRLPTVAGRIDEAAIQAGVGCVRCHPQAAAHAQASHRGQTIPAGPVWKSLSPLESVRRCGECHRRDDQYRDEELQPDNELLIRFASVGLTQSSCFLSQTNHRLDCLTCHDPHQAAADAAALSVAQCLNCHQPAADHAPCPKTETGSDCLACHMPSVGISPDLAFTDHWIRIPANAEARAERRAIPKVSALPTE